MLNDACVVLPLGPAPYVPPTPTEDENEIFKKVHTGINFDKQDEIPVECTGNAAITKGLTR